MTNHATMTRTISASSAQVTGERFTAPTPPTGAHRGRGDWAGLTCSRPGRESGDDLRFPYR